MAASSTIICNAGLIKVGAKMIASLSDNTKEARICNFQYSISRDFLLAQHSWSFATKRDTLTADATAPEFGFDYRFALPADYLSHLALDPDYKEHKVEAGYILCNSSEIDVIYTFKQTTTTMFSKEFDEALACHLGSQIAYSLVQNDALKNSLFQEANHWVSIARSVDSRNSTPIKMKPNTWLDARYSGGSYQSSSD